MPDTMKASAATVLRRTADHFAAHPDSWGKGYHAVDRIGSPVLTSSPQACKFCVAGRVIREAGYFDGNVQYLNEIALKTLAFEVGKSVFDWNDEPARSVGDVVEALRRAAATLAKETADV